LHGVASFSKVAGDYGIPEEESGADRVKASENSGNSVEPPTVCGAQIVDIPVEVEQEEGEEDKPDYIRCVDISPTLMLQTKKMYV
jgi:hypothetical protein